MYILAPPQSLWSSSSELSETLPPRLESFVRPLTHNFDVVHFSSVDRRMCGGHGKKNHKAHCSYQYLAVFLEQTLLGIVQAFNFQSSSKFILRVFVVFSLLLWRNSFLEVLTQPFRKQLLLLKYSLSLILMHGSSPCQ